MNISDKIYEIIGLKIHKYRKAANIKQENLAKEIGLTRTSIVNIEKGSQKIQIDKLYEIAEFFNKEITDFLPLIDVIKNPIDSYSKNRISDETQQEVLKIIKKDGDK